MKKISLALLSFVMVGVASCSWLTDFVVANNSDKAITLMYKFSVHGREVGRDCEKIVRQNPPGITTIDKIKGRTYRVMTPTDYAFGKDKCEVGIELKPGQAVRVGRINTYTGHDSGRDEYFAVGSFEIIAEKGKLYFEGHEMVKQFKKVTDSLYLYEYK